MKKVIYTCIFVLSFLSCNSDNEIRKECSKYEFVKEYSATITVGGFVGITKRVFKVGEVYVGKEQDNGNIKIRIAKHSKINEEPPSNASYQEFLEVPKEYLRLGNYTKPTKN